MVTVTSAGDPGSDDEHRLPAESSDRRIYKEDVMALLHIALVASVAGRRLVRLRAEAERQEAERRRRRPSTARQTAGRAQSGRGGSGG